MSESPATNNVGATIWLIVSTGQSCASLLNALTFSIKCGQSLGGATTAVYWHFQSKEDLLSVAADQVWQEVTFFDPEELGWYEATRMFVSETHSLFRRHRWLIPVITSYGTYGAFRAAHQEHCYILLESAGFKGLALDAAVNTLLIFTFGIAFAESMDSSKTEQSAADFLCLPDHMKDRSGVSSEVVKSSNFEFGLATILEGFKVQLSADKHK